jgi:hypothetical protein
VNRIKNGAAILACLLVVAGIRPKGVMAEDSPSVPKLVNPSFEDRGESADRAAGWERWGHWFNREEGWTPVRTGHCILGYHHWEIPDPSDSGVFQDVHGAVKGTAYTFGIYANLDKAKDTNQDAQTIEMRLESTVDGKQQTLASKVYKVADMKPDEWEKLAVTGAPTNDTLRVLVIVTPGAVDGLRGGAIRFDDAFLDAAR